MAKVIIYTTNYCRFCVLDATGGLDRLLGKSTKKTSLLN